MAKIKGINTETLESRYERYKDILRDLTIMSDVFMRNILKQKECTEYILQIIMNRKELKIIDQVIQKDYKNLQGRSAVLGLCSQRFGRKPDECGGTAGQ